MKIPPVSSPGFLRPRMRTTNLLLLEMELWMKMDVLSSLPEGMVYLSFLDFLF
jgi:hypothetical protein